MAPEVEAGQAFNGADADFFALGVIAFIMIIGRPPFVHSDFTDPHYRSLYAKNTEDFWIRQRQTNLDSEIQDFMVSMLAVEPSDRVRTAESIRRHPWMQVEVATSEDVKQYVLENL